MERKFDRKIVLEDGSVYIGSGFGARCEKICEVVFNTSMIGYQEIVSDPAYTYQMVVMTYPLIGNYGITDDDFETKFPTIGGLIVREYNDVPSHFRYIKTLSEMLEENGIPAISGVDTRKLTRSIRNIGSHKVIITDIDTPDDVAMEKLRAYAIPNDAVSRVSCSKKWYSRTSNPKYNVVAVDCGGKKSVIKSLNMLGCNVTVVPYNMSADEIESLRPDGIFLTNGPGNPEDVTQVIQLVRELRGKYPICGMCLGHQIIALSYGAKTYKLKFGHHGGNHPIKNIKTNAIDVASQNHGYAVSADSIKGTGLSVTHINLLDDTIEGLECEKDKLFSVQYYHDGILGPQDSVYMYDRFITMMEENKNA